MISPFATLAENAVGWRQGQVAELRGVPAGLSDIDVAGWAAVAEPFRPGHTSGGAGVDSESARLAAIAEAIERYAAARCPLEVATHPPGASRWELAEFSLHSSAQRADPAFPFSRGYREHQYTRAWTLPDNAEVWVPAGLVGLADGIGLPVTSTGLAAATSTTAALLFAAQELVERDSLAVTWLHGRAPDRVPMPVELTDPVTVLGGEVTAFDLTPAFSPHPVIAVAGRLPLEGRPRATLGLACRADARDAMHKAWLEWCQGTVFLRVWLSENADTTLSPDDVTDFDTHAAYYTANPRAWDALPCWYGPQMPLLAPSPAASSNSGRQLAELVHALDDAGIRLAYRELTTPEAASLGLRVVRVLAPELTPLHADHRWPHLGGRTGDLSWRYPGARPSAIFPSPHPHPLG